MLIFENIDSAEVHYFRNRLNVEYSWEDFEKLNKRLPEKYRWEQMKWPLDKEHQNTAPLFKRNKKYVSFDGYFEIVFSDDGVLLNEERASLDMGTYNYAPSTQEERLKAIFGHIFSDMLPYYMMENTEKDKKQKEKRVMDDIKWR